MTVTSQGKHAASARANVLSVCLGALALAGGLFTLQALAQSAVTNTATVAPPAGVVDSNPDNDSDSASISVTARQPDFGSCDATMYLGQNAPTGLFEFDTSANPFVVNPVGPTAPFTYNAIGYNPVDNYIYGLRGPAPATLVRIGSDGSVVDLGTVAGLPINSIVGEFGPDGTYYVGAGFTLYRVDIPSMTATSVSLGMSLNGADFAWHNDRLYMAATNGGQLLEIDPTTGSVTPLGVTGVPGGFGGMFGASNGVFGSNNDGGFYQFDLTTGAATLISELQGSSNNDGAKCPTTPLVFPADLAIEKDDGSDTYVAGEDVVYEIVVSNLGPFGVSGATVNDPLPAGITEATWTCGNATGGGTCGVAGGTGAIADVPVNLPAGASVTFTLTLSVPEDFTGELTNIATVTNPDGSPDPNPDNNTDEDTDTVEPAVVTVEKTSDPAPGQTVSVGQTLAYTLTATVAQGPLAGDLSLTDTPGAGLAFGEVTDAGDFTCTGALDCTLPAGTLPGTYALTYTATVAPGATGSVGNTVVATGDDDPTCVACQTEHPVQPDFGTCSADMYLAQNIPTGLFRFDTASNPFEVDPLGPASDHNYNAIALNPVDNYIYGMVSTAGTPGTLGRIGSDGSVEVLGPVSGLGVNSVSGEIGPDGAFYLYAGGQLYTVDIPTMTATSVPLSPNVVSLDMAWHDGRLYAAVTNGSLFSIDPATGVTTEIGPTGVAGNFGAMFGASNGVFGGNNAGGFYRFDLATGAATLISDLPGSTNNDGAKCVTTPLEFPADLAIEKDNGTDTYVPGEDVTYTIVVSNLGPFGAAGATVDDPLPAGITEATWTCGNATGGGTCGLAGGTGAIADVPVNLPAGASVTFTLTLSVPDDFTDELVNTATVTSPEGSPDPNPDNNTDTDTDTPEIPTIAVSKSADPPSGAEVRLGDVLTYTLTVTVGDAPTLQPFELTDTLGAGLSFGEVTDAGDFTCSGELVCALPAATPPGTYALTYTATVDADATGAIGNNVTITGDGGDPDPECTSCQTEHVIEPPIPSDIPVLSCSSSGYQLNTAHDAQTGGMLTSGLDPYWAIAITPTSVTGTPPADLVYTAATVVSNPTPAWMSSPFGNANWIAHNETAGHTVNIDAFYRYQFNLDPAVDPTQVNLQMNFHSDNAVYEVWVNGVAQGVRSNYGAGDPYFYGGFIPGSEASAAMAGAWQTGLNTMVVHVKSAPGAQGFMASVHPEAICMPEIGTAKTVVPASGSQVQAGQTLTYTLTTTVENGPTTEPFQLTDTLGAGLSFGAVTGSGDFACTGALECVLPAGTVPGTYAVTYTATVDADATGALGNSVVGTGGGDDDPVCDPCETEHEVGPPAISTAKTAQPGEDVQVQPGQTLTYILTTTVAGAATSEPFLLTDTLGTGLSFGEVTDAGDFACTGTLQCTLPAGAPPGTYAVTYTATVDADATGTVGNAVTATGGGDEDPECAPCGTEHEVEAPTIAVAKTAVPGAGAQVVPGQALTYTLTATVATSATTAPLVLTDTLGAGLGFGEVTDAGAFACTGALQCTLPAGTLPGTYAVTYTAIVNDDATGTVGNAVTATGGGDDDPVCDPCETEHEVEPATIAVAKTADPGTGAQVVPGQVLTYTLTATVTTSATTAPLVLTDTPGAGLSFGEVTEPGAFACTGALQCTLPAGTLPGSYALSYIATVDDDATGTVGNAVTATGGGDDDPVCSPCETEHEVEPATIAVAKTAEPGAGAQVVPGQVLTYTLTATVATSATTAPLVLTDTLGEGLSFGEVTAVGAFACTGALQCTLPAGTLPGSYAVTYTATVAADATGTVGNAVTATGGGDDDPVCSPCETEHEVEPATIAVTKTASPGDGAQVTPGDTLTYTLTATVATSATTSPLVLNDTLGAGLGFGEVTDAGAFTCSGTLQCTLPTGTLPGTYAVTYTATVDADATGTVGNAVTATGGGDDDPVCSPCETGHEVEPATIAVTKTSSPGDGAQVTPGDTLTYTLTATIATSATTGPLVLADTLGEGLTFGEVTDAGAFACSGALQCTLPTGTLPGTYAVSYTATVAADATGTVGNAVTATGGGGEDPVCSPCETEHEVEPATIAVTKTSSPGDGAQVRPGDILTYTLTATVATSATSEPLVLTDTLGAGLSFGEVTAPGSFACSGALQCTLPAGTLPGIYAVTYTATVDADATGTLGNNVAATGGGGEDPVCAPCETGHEVELPTIAVAKTADPGAGAEVRPGDTLTYTLTTTVAVSATTAPFVLIDTLGAGLGFGAVTDAGAFACSGALQCTLPAGTVPGTYAVTYTAIVDADATGTLGNSVVASGGGDDDPECAPCETGHEVEQPTIAVAKTADPGAGAEVRPGDTLTYTLTATVAVSATTAPLVLTDTLGAGLSFGAVTDTGAFACSGALQCTLPAGTLPGIYALTYTATVDADATGMLGNAVAATGGGNDPECTPCETGHEVEQPTIAVAKSAAPGVGTEVLPGDTLTYTLTATVAVSATTEPLVLTDTLGAGLSFGAVTDAGAFACSGELQCTLPAGTLPGAYAVTYTATVDADATGTLGNRVVATGGGGDPECATCETEHPVALPTIATAKTALPGEGVELRPGDTVTYTLTTTVAVSATTAPFVLADTLGEGLAYGAVTDAGAFACTGALECTLPAGTLPGTYAVVYTATIAPGAGGTVANSVVATGGGDDAPTCDPCRTEHEVELPTITTRKAADPPSGNEVRVGDVITYTLTVTVDNAATLDAFVLEDTPSGGQTLLADSIEVPAGGSCRAVDEGLECELAAGTPPGTYDFHYRAQVAPGAVGDLGNVVVPRGNGNLADCESCSTLHPLAEPVVTIAKTADPGDGAEVRVGDSIAYTLAVTIEHAALATPVRLVDTPGPGLTVTALPEGCSGDGDGFACTLAVGTPPGTYTFDYVATVDPDAVDEVNNAVLAEYGGANEPVCQPCGTSHTVLSEAELRIVKTAGARAARIGDLVRYTLVVENVGTVDLLDGTVFDTPPAGFNYVEGSMSVADGDGAFTLAPSRHPLRIGGLDIAMGERATIVYLLRIGAGVRHGTQVNEAVARNPAGTAISNVATAQVAVEADPLLDDSLIFGTVFDDRDGDGWQDSAALSGLRVQGGFAPGAYIAGSTTIDRGAGAEPVADASAPLLHGIALGGIAARQSVADPVQARQVIVRQRLREPAFTNDFVLTSDQGVTVRMDAAGTTTVEHTGEAARGLNAAEPVVERRVAQGEGGVVVDYVIGNAGIDERGIPGVRVASVDGLLIETDQYGRYHLVDVQGGERGYRNFILKVDPSTLPPGTVFTTDNPLVRRITPGLPVRFDFGVRLPAEPIPGPVQEVALALGEVIFAPGSAEIREAYRPAIARMAEQIDAYGGGEVTIAADGDTRALAYDRAHAVRDALLGQVSAASAAALAVNVRAQEGGALVAGATEGGALLGTVLFDTDRAEIRPEFEPLLDRVAARLEAMGRGRVGVVGHADVRGSADYNVALGMRRARAVYEALARRLSPEVRAQVHVESSDDPAAPVGRDGEREGAGS